MKTFLSLWSNIRKVTLRLSDCHRWGQFKRSYRQTSFEHSYQIALLAGALAKRENKIGKNLIDVGQIVLHALVHDWGEGITGDLTYEFKNHPLIKQMYTHIERQATHEFINDFPIIKHELLTAYELKEGAVEQEFFAAIELLDYMLYAVAEYDEGNSEFVKVFQRQHTKLLSVASQFPSIAEIYTTEVAQWVGLKLKKHKPELKQAKSQSKALTSKDIDQILMVFDDLEPSVKEYVLRHLEDKLNAKPFKP